MTQCRNWASTGTCTFGNSCRFVHGPVQQQPRGNAGGAPRGNARGFTPAPHQSGFQQPAGYAQPRFQQPAGFSQPGFQQPAGFQQPGFQQPAGFQQPGFQQPSGRGNSKRNSSPFVGLRQPATAPFQQQQPLMMTQPQGPFVQNQPQQRFHPPQQPFHLANSSHPRSSSRHNSQPRGNNVAQQPSFQRPGFVAAPVGFGTQPPQYQQPLPPPHAMQLSSFSQSQGTLSNVGFGVPQQLPSQSFYPLHPNQSSGSFSNMPTDFSSSAMAMDSETSALASSSFVPQGFQGGNFGNGSSITSAAGIGRFQTMVGLDSVDQGAKRNQDSDDANEIKARLGECEIPATHVVPAEQAKAAFAADKFEFRSIPEDIAPLYA